MKPTYTTQLPFAQLQNLMVKKWCEGSFKQLPNNLNSIPNFHQRAFYARMFAFSTPSCTKR